MPSEGFATRRNPTRLCAFNATEKKIHPIFLAPPQIGLFPAMDDCHYDSTDEEMDLLLLLALVRMRKRRRRKRSMWVRPIFTLRRKQGEYHNLLQEMRLSDPESHFRYLRMSKERFESLLQMVCALWNQCFRICIPR